MNIVLGVCGSVSAYRACDILRGFTKNNHQVKVVLTKGAEKFVRPKIFSYLGANAVYTWEDDFTKKEDTILHIDLKNWLDRLVIAPASANTMAKLNAGLCDDLLSSLFLAATEKEKIIFPAMNTAMLNNKITKENFTRLSELPLCHIASTAEGTLACGEEGAGKLANVDTIVSFIEYFAFTPSEKTVLITTGATQAAVDPVRYLTNPASGKTGIELAKTYLKAGRKVILIAGASTALPEFFKILPALKAIKVKTTSEMYKEVKKHFNSVETFIAAAAVGDIEFDPQANKIKKQTSNSLNFKWSVDILAEMLNEKKNQKVVSFAAESPLTDAIIKTKFDKKPVDLMVANEVHNGISGKSDSLMGFSQDENDYHFVKAGKVAFSKHLTKTALAEEIFNTIEYD